MITDNTGKAVFDHVMKAGDVYKVPNEAGLSLTTGNGNGITLSLDGADLPKVATGSPHVVRDISLDPDHLTSDSSNTDQ
jgi:cytoskeleton protein RodZ